MTWQQASEGLLNLEDAYFIFVNGDGAFWNVNIVLSAGVVNTSNSTQSTFTTVTDVPEADAQSAAKQLAQLCGGRWVYSPANANQWFRADFIYEFVVTGTGTSWFTQAYLNKGIVPSGAGYSASPGITQYTSEADANAGLALLAEQLTIANAGG